MSIRDQEISRLIKYAESLNISIEFKPYKRSLPVAIWELLQDGKRKITIYTWNRLSKTSLILNLLHELAHEKSYILQNRKLDKATEMATSLPEEELTKEQRKLIYLAEKEDAQYRLDIAHELDLKIPKWKIEMDMDLDIYVYKMFYIKARYPNREELLKKKKELKEKYASKIQEIT